MIHEKCGVIGLQKASAFTVSTLRPDEAYVRHYTASSLIYSVVWWCKCMDHPSYINCDVFVDIINMNLASICILYVTEYSVQDYELMKYSKITTFCFFCFQVFFTGFLPLSDAVDTRMITSSMEFKYSLSWIGYDSQGKLLIVSLFYSLTWMLFPRVLDFSCPPHLEKCCSTWIIPMVWKGLNSAFG